MSVRGRELNRVTITVRYGILRDKVIQNINIDLRFL